MKLNSDGGKAVRAVGARAQRRSRGGLTLAVCGLALVAMALFGTSAAGAAEGDEVPTEDTTLDATLDTTPAPLADVEPTVEEGEIITITQEALASDGQCNPLAQAQLTYTANSTDEVFELVITSLTTPCSPIAAAAVAYAMPAGASPAGGQWPQTLAERKDFTISQASVTTVTFAKECAALQFDVLTGESPQTISPTGPWHGPLLFVGDTNTSQQYFPPAEECGGPTTTTTTIVPVTVLPATTVPQVATNVVSPEAVVADTSATNGNEGASLALTGSSSGGLALLGGVLLLAGAAMFAWSRRSQED